MPCSLSGLVFRSAMCASRVFTSSAVLLIWVPNGRLMSTVIMLRSLSGKKMNGTRPNPFKDMRNAANIRQTKVRLNFITHFSREVYAEFRLSKSENLEAPSSFFFTLTK